MLVVKCHIESAENITQQLKLLNSKETFADDMLLPQQTKRQSFSIESLAVSSRVEQERDTDSPYLNYLEGSKSSAACVSRVDYNSNVALNWTQYHRYYTDQGDKPLVIDEKGCGQEPPNNAQQTCYNSGGRLTLSDYSTSTPKLPPPKRRRLESTSTSPSSDDSAADDKMVTDESSILSGEYPEVEKTSPVSTTSSTTSGILALYFFSYN